MILISFPTKAYCLILLSFTIKKGGTQRYTVISNGTAYNHLIYSSEQEVVLETSRGAPPSPNHPLDLSMSDTYFLQGLPLTTAVASDPSNHKLSLILESSVKFLFIQLIQEVSNPTEYWWSKKPQHGTATQQLDPEESCIGKAQVLSDRTYLSTWHCQGL